MNFRNQQARSSNVLCVLLSAEANLKTFFWFLLSTHSLVRKLWPRISQNFCPRDHCCSETDSIKKLQNSRFLAEVAISWRTKRRGCWLRKCVCRINNSSSRFSFVAASACYTVGSKLSKRFIFLPQLPARATVTSVTTATSARATQKRANAKGRSLAVLNDL